MKRGKLCQEAVPPRITIDVKLSFKTHIKLARVVNLK